MRVLFVSSPGAGHVFPMVPLAWALRAAGHEVLVATTDTGLIAARAGLPVVDLAPDVDLDAVRTRLLREEPRLAELALKGGLDDVREAVGAFAHISALLADGLVAAALTWRPDLVVQSQLQGAGLVAAARIGVPLVDHGFGFARTGGLAALFRGHMAEVFDRHGVDLPARHAVIDVAPPSMLDGPPQGWSMRYVPYNGGAQLPAWLSDPPERPRVAVSVGTVVPERNGLRSLRRLVDAASEVDAEFVLALGEADPTPLGPLPANVRPVGWVPLNSLLPTCRAIVHHGGAGTTLTALACGVPQLVLPNGADRHINALAARRRNTALVSSPEDVTDHELRSVLADDALRSDADDVRREIEALPTPADTVDRLVRLATPRRPR
ncbi:nucleotide disphospho-sugar-binding domain-containing protein [Actinosynnema sp. NPDC050801]|uniref:nucleotide disphospho-sugar-binding domain-containing protein n=1 Tax=unclassified Actinosynnema TaxID=2637065 RepID=UPI0034097751